MNKCTQPELWANRPGSDASEEEVARYLDHLDQCAFHAEIERRNERTVRGIAAFAVGDAAPAAKKLNSRAIEVKPRYDSRAIRWGLALKVAAAVAIIAMILLLPLYFFRTKSTRERVAVPAESPWPSPSREAIAKNGAKPTPSTGPNANTGRPRQISLATVKRVYVAEVEGAYRILLRAALIDELQRSERFTVVGRAAEADAVLEVENTRGPNVRVQLENRVGKPLWFTVQDTNDQSEAGTREVAARAIRTLIQDAR